MAILPGDYGSRVILAALRFMLAGLILLALVGLGRRFSLKVERKYWPAVVISGILQISLQYFFFYNGLANTTGMKGAILQSCCTFFVVLFAHFCFANDRLNWKKVFGLVTGFGGIILVNWGQAFTLEFTLTGEGFLILAGIASAAAMIQSKNLTQNIDAFVLTGWQMVIGAVFLFFTGFMEQRTLFLKFSLLTGGLLVYSAFLSAAAFSLWYVILKYHKAGEIEIYRFIIPVSGALLSSLLIPGENLDRMMAGALLLVTVGIFAVNHSAKPRRKPQGD
jgi:drug/metabolite transporter (DMT)-like permease